MTTGQITKMLDHDDLDHAPRPGGCLTLATLQRALDRLRVDGLLFRLNDEQIARHFTQMFFEGNAWQVNLDQLREVIAALDGCPGDVPADPQKFPEWVRKELLYLEHLPKQKLAELYDWASKDLLAIKANIAYCERAIHEVERRSPKTDGDLYDVRFYKYYRQLNQDAKEEIVDVLTHDIYHAAFRASVGAGGILSAASLLSPWSFRWKARIFDPTAFSPIRHAFGELPTRLWPEVQRLYEEQDRTQFDQYLEEYISETKPTEKIRCLVDEHHLLAARRSVLLPALEAYRQEEFPFFASAVAPHVEGIIEDACLLSGISLHKLRQGSISDKLDALVRDAPIYIDYAYYAFKFPVLRNRIAHGRMLTSDVHRVAHLLVLDLYNCCRIVREHPGAPNALVELLRRVKPDKATLANVVDFAAMYAETNGEPPSYFYGLGREFDEFTLLLDRQTVWDFLEDLLGPQSEEIDIGLRFIGNRLKKASPTQRTFVASLLAKLGARGEGKFDRRAFISGVHGFRGARSSGEKPR